MTITFERLIEDIQKTRTLDEAGRQLVFTLSKIIDEEKTLQTVVDREGMVYETTGDKGQTYIKVRPEYDQLQKLRDKKRAYIAAIGVKEGESINPDFA